MILTPGSPEIYHLWTGIERGLDQGWGAVSLPCPGSTEHIIAVWAGLCITAKSAADRRLWVTTGDYRTATWPSASPRLTEITERRFLPILPVAEPLGRYVPATLACSKRERLQPRYRGLAFAIGPRGIGPRMSLCEPLPRAPDTMVALD